MVNEERLQVDNISCDQYAGCDPLKATFEYFADPISPNHLQQLRVVLDEGTRRLRACASAAGLYTLASGERRFQVVDTYQLSECHDQTAVDTVRDWLFKRGVPFRRRVFALGDQDHAVATTWKMVVRYWEAFENSPGGLGTLVFDHLLRWGLWFDHEEVILYGSNRSPF